MLRVVFEWLTTIDILLKYLSPALSKIPAYVLRNSPYQTTNSVSWSLKEPTPEDVLAEITPCEPCVEDTELAEIFDDVNRWTIRRRFEALHEDRPERREDSENRVS